MTLDYDEAGFKPLVRPSNPARRRLLARAGLAVVLVGAVVAGGAYWKVQAPERARHRYAKQLVPAEAAWPAAQARIAALPLPAGWDVDPNGTACEQQEDATSLCLVTNSADRKQAMDAAVAMLKRAGASDHDALMNAFKATLGDDGAQLEGCQSVASQCQASVGWEGASVGIVTLDGSDLADQPVSVLLSRSSAYLQPAHTVSPDAPLPTSAAGVATLTGLTSALGPPTCAQRPKTGSGCLSWHITLTSPRAPAELQRELARTLAAHGFRIETRLPNDNQNFTHVLARLNRGPHGTDSVLAFVTLRANPTGDGTTLGSVFVASGAIYGS